MTSTENVCYDFFCCFSFSHSALHSGPIDGRWRWRRRLYTRDNMASQINYRNSAAFLPLRKLFARAVFFLFFIQFIFNVVVADTIFFSFFLLLSLYVDVNGSVSLARRCWCCMCVCVCGCVYGYVYVYVCTMCVYCMCVCVYSSCSSNTINICTSDVLSDGDWMYSSWRSVSYNIDPITAASAIRKLVSLSCDEYHVKQTASELRVEYSLVVTRWKGATSTFIEAKPNRWQGMKRSRGTEGAMTVQTCRCIMHSGGKKIAAKVNCSSFSKLQYIGVEFNFCALQKVSGIFLAPRYFLMDFSFMNLSILINSTALCVSGIWSIHFHERRMWFTLQRIAETFLDWIEWNYASIVVQRTATRASECRSSFCRFIPFFWLAFPAKVHSKY